MLPRKRFAAIELKSSTMYLCVEVHLKKKISWCSVGTKLFYRTVFSLLEQKLCLDFLVCRDKVIASQSDLK